MRAPLVRQKRTPGAARTVAEDKAASSSFLTLSQCHYFSFDFLIFGNGSRMESCTSHAHAFAVHRPVDWLREPGARRPDALDLTVQRTLPAHWSTTTRILPWLAKLREEPSTVGRVPVRSDKQSLIITKSSTYLRKPTVHPT